MPLKLNIPLPSLGQVADRPGEYVDQRAVTSIKNMEFSRSVIRKRSGTLALGASLGERVQRVFELQVGVTTRLFRIGLTKAQAYDKATDTWASVTSTPLTGGESNPVSYAFPVLAGEKVAVYTNFIDPVRKCSVSGMDAALGGSPPKAKFAYAYGDYLILANIQDGGNIFPARVQWPDTGDPENWAQVSGSNAGSQDLLEDPEDITGLGVFGGMLTVHKKSSIYLGQVVTTSAVFRFEQKPTGVGTVAGATIQNIPSGEQIFLASDGIHLFNGLTAPLIDSPVQDEIREQANPAYLYKAQSVYVKELDEYWVCIAMGSDTEPRTIYKYNWRTRQIYKDDRANLTALGTFLNTNQQTIDDAGTTPIDSMTGVWDSVTDASLNPVVIFGDSAGVTTRRTSGTYNDNGAAFEALWETKDFTAKDFDLPDIDRMMRWKGLEMWALGSSVKVYYSTDGGESWRLAKTLSLSSSYPSDSAPQQIYFDAVASRCRLRLVNGQSGESFTLKQYQLEATPREARK